MEGDDDSAKLNIPDWLNEPADADLVDTVSNMKELLRSVISSQPGRACLRAIIHNSPLPYARRRDVYLRVGKKVRIDSETVFDHQELNGSLTRFHLDGTVRELYWLGDYETESLPLFLEYSRQAKTILDIGSADGAYALLAASVSPRARILAFEPGSQQLVRLRANIELNTPGLGSQVEVVEVALSDHDGEEAFYEQLGGTSSLNPEFRVGSVPRLTTLRTGDAVVSELLNGDRVDLMKIDTESTEPDVIAGLRQTISRDRPVIFCEVLCGRSEGRLQPLMDDFGYSSWLLSDSGPVLRRKIVGHPEFVNWLFLPDGTAPLSV